MDSSNSQHSQPVSTSDTGSGSDGSVFSSRTLSGYGGSTGETSPSAGNNAPELLPEGENSSSSMNWKSSTCDQQEDEEDMDVDTTKSWMPTEFPPESSAGKEKMVDTATSSSSREGKAEEIGLLTDLHNLHNKTGRYLLSGSNDQQDFYKFWIEEEGDYANKEELDKKINELHARFLKNMDKNVEGPIDPIDVEILRLSHWIWGSEIDSCYEREDDDQDTKDLSDVNMVDDGQDGVNPNESSQHESAEARHKFDDVDSKDSMKENGSPINK